MDSPSGLLGRSAAVTVIGMATLDYLYVLKSHPVEDSENEVQEHRTAVGGPAGRGALTAGRLGATTTLLAMCGTGIHAAVLRRALAAEPVETVWFDADQPSQHSCVIVAADTGSRTTIWTAQPRADTALLGAVAESIVNADAVLLDCTDPALTERAIRACRTAGVPVVIDTGSFKPWSPGLLQGVDYIITPAKFFRSWRPDLGEDEAIRAAFIEFGPTVLAATMGARGGAYIDGHGLHRFDAVGVDAVDSCGAGDVFHGAFTWSVAVGAPAEMGLRVAAWAAARKCAVLGNAGLPDRRALQAHLRAG